jgi:hypothetical protein
LLIGISQIEGEHGAAGQLALHVPASAKGIAHLSNKCTLPVFFIYRGGTGICVRPNRYALARSLGVPLEPDELALHECDHPLCVKVCAADAPRQHVVAGDQIENMRRMARMRRGGGRSAISSDGLHARRQRSVALRAVLRERGWDRGAVEAALLGDMPTLW